MTEDGEDYWNVFQNTSKEMMGSIWEEFEEGKHNQDILWLKIWKYIQGHSLSTTYILIY